MTEPPNSSILNLGPPMRPGQRGAVNAIWRNVREEERHTGIVLPTRYGKSDVIKVSGIGLLLDRLVSRVIILEPARILVSQIVDRRKFEETGARYEIPPVLGSNLSVFAVDSQQLRLPFPPNNAQFVSMTIQKADSNRAFIARWIASDREHRGRPPIFFIDEAHTGSQENQWGATARAIAEAGAFQVLMTATPFRTDQMPIEGFVYVETGTSAVSYVADDALWAGERIRYQLVPDWETTFQEAWAELPPALCYIARVPIGIDMRRVDSGTGETAGTVPLSDTPRYASATALAELTRTDYVVRDGCTKLIEALQDMRPTAPGVAAIVFVGSDAEGEDNEHARQVAGVLGDLWPADWGRPQIVIATSTFRRDDDNEAAPNNARARIQAFQDGTGDVLIVKQMGGVGTDIPRLKVCLDLSTVRTAQNFTQRICRIATIWQVGPDPEDQMLRATYITPDDLRSRELFDALVRRQGGDASIVTVERMQELQQASAGSQGQRSLPDTFVPEGLRASDMADTQGRTASTDELPNVHQVVGAFPEVSLRRTEPEIANIIEQLGIRFGGNDPDGPAPVQEPAPQFRVRDIASELAAGRTEVSRLAPRVAANRVRELQGQGGAPTYSDVIRSVYVDHKRRAGWPLNRALDDISVRVEDLARLAESLREEMNNG